MSRQYAPADKPSDDVAKGVSEVLIRLVIDGRRWDFVFEGQLATDLLKVDDYIAACVEHVRLIQKPLPRIVGCFSAPEPDAGTNGQFKAESIKP